MRYSSLIDNVTAQEWGLNIQQAYLFDWMHDLPSWANSMVFDGVTYYFAAKTQAVKELPLLTDKVDTMYRYYQQLERSGLILLKKADGKDFVTLTEKGRKWNRKSGEKSEWSEQRSEVVGKESGKSPEKNPTYPITISNPITSDHVSDETSVSEKPSAFEERKEEFKKRMLDAGVLKYTKRMLDDFFAYWTESNWQSKKPKMRWEKEAGFDFPRRFGTWLANNDGKYRCLLTENEVSIKQKQLNLRNSMIPFFDKYSKDMLEAFFKYWIQPENKPEPEYIRWEQEKFWDLAQRLSQWAARNENKKS